MHKLSIGLLLCLVNTAAAQGRLPDIATLPALLDTAVPAMMAERHIPGAAIAVVHQGQVIYLRGFGEPIVGAGQPVDASTTTFRIGSVSKFFTAIAALQLAEAGRLDLQADISRYAPDLPLRYPTTMHQLLTHTAGFDERFAGAYTESTALPALSDHLRRDPPQQVMRPGVAYSYSNYNFAVAGAVIEKVSGQRFEQYLADRVFTPLRMTATTAYQPPPPDVKGTVARGYRWSGDDQEPLAIRFTFASPSGGVTSSAADMASLMIALLESGDSGGERILSPAAIGALFASQYTSHPRIPAAAYGTVHWQTHGRELIFKDGTLGDQIGVVVLDPGNRFGIFLASNALPGIEAVLAPLLDHVFGPALTAAPPVPIAGAAARTARYAGTFRDFHHTRNDLSRLRALMPIIQTRVIAEAGGTIRWRGRQWIEIEPLVFQSADGAAHIAFREDEAGAITQLHAWGASYERIGFFERAPFHLAVLLLSVLVFGAYVVVRIAHRKAPGASGGSLAARRLGVAVAVVNLVFVAGLVIFFRNLGETVPLPVAAVLWLALSLVSLAITAIVGILAAAAWRYEWWTRGERARYSVLAIAAVSFITFLNYWKLLGFRY